MVRDLLSVDEIKRLEAHQIDRETAFYPEGDSEVSVGIVDEKKRKEVYRNSFLKFPVASIESIKRRPGMFSGVRINGYLRQSQEPNLPISLRSSDFSEDEIIDGISDAHFSTYYVNQTKIPSSVYIPAFDRMEQSNYEGPITVWGRVTLLQDIRPAVRILAMGTP